MRKSGYYLEGKELTYDELEDIIQQKVIVEFKRMSKWGGPKHIAWREANKTVRRKYEQR